MKNKKTIDPSEIKILVCCHKKCELPPNPDGIFLPIQVGAAISDVDLGIQRDDQVNGQPCDNISDKNKSYCELTALYWAWKNIKKIYPNIKYIGLNHYRRFFDFERITHCDYITENESEISKYHFNSEKLCNILSQYKFIAPKKKTYPYTIGIHYCNSHISEDYEILKKTLINLFPEYERSFHYVFEINNKISFYNMFICSYEDFCSYCEWLFAILFEVEKKCDISNYNQLQGRIFGYMAERLLNVYIFHNKFKLKYYPVVWYLKTKEKTISIWKYVIHNIKNNISNHFLYLACVDSVKQYFADFIKYHLRFSDKTINKLKKIFK